MEAPRRATPPIVFLILLTPFGVSGGYVGVTLAFLLAKAGLATAAVAAIVSFTVWPQTWKVLWAPFLDTALNAKAWYGVGVIVTGLSILALSAVPASVKAVPLLTLLVVLSSLASTLVSISSELFMAHGIEDARKGAVSGWSQAGNLGGAGLGGGAGLYLSQHVNAPWVAGAALAALCLVCGAGLWFVDEPARAARLPRYRDALVDVIRDVWAVMRSRPGFLVLVLMVLPIGSGGAQGVWSAIASEWRTGPDTIALVSGVLGGLASLVGALAGGYACDRMDRRTAYCVFGAALAGVAVAMALLPRTPMEFILCTLAYALVIGACYAAYSATVLEAIGRGAAGTKYNLLASVSNIPIAVMTATDGVLHDRYGSSGMLFGEAGVAIMAIAGFAALARLTRPARATASSPARP
jgi:MFS family permease